MSKKLISIVIVNYRVKELLLQCLKSVYAQAQSEHYGLEVLVVDNASDDGSVAAVSSQYPEVILFPNTQNIGFPAANNQAFKQAKGEWIFMLNPDAELTANALEDLLNFALQKNNLGLVAPKLLNSDGSHQYSVWKYPSIKQIAAEMLHLSRLVKSHYYLDHSFDQPMEVESASGAALFFPRIMFEKLGYLDESLFWIEDIDWCYRMKQQGLSLWYNPAVKVIHHIGQSAKKNYKISISNQIFNKIKFFAKHGSSYEVLFVKTISFLNVVLRTIVLFVLSPLNKVYYYKSKAYLYTSLRVFNPPKGMA